MKTKSFLMTAFLSIILLGCSGGSMLITASNTSYPVSASSVVFSENGSVIIPQEQTILEHFNISFTRWSILWTIVGFSSYEKDISIELDKIIAKKKGSAIVNLSVRPNENPLSMIFSTITTLVPVFPTGHTVYIEGDVIIPKDPNIKIFHK
jgi:hypothetical protein